MYETLIKHPKLRVWRTTGTEGPRHDPYGYDEIHAELPSGSITYHMGLGSWVKLHDGKPGRRAAPIKKLDERTCTEADLRKMFELTVGFSINQIERIHRKLKSRCRKCGCKHTEWVAGYPGEHMEQCVGCGHIVGGYFCRSEVE
jgi:hypothetical protein